MNILKNLVKNSFKIFAAFFIVFSFSKSVFPYNNIAKNTAVVRFINKLSSKMEVFEIPVGDSKVVDNLILTVRACYGRPENELQENSMFIEVYEKSNSYVRKSGSTQQGKKIFSGWMFSSTTSLNPLQHPNYDLWVLECKDTKTTINESN